MTETWTLYSTGTTILYVPPVCHEEEAPEILQDASWRMLLL
jgi:hypothetical protein